MSRYAEGRTQRGFVIDDETYRAAQISAAANGVTVTSIVAAALEAYAAANPVRTPRKSRAKKDAA